ncbi:uncharacterized protein ARMOST_22254 [Armillaria ostoyae]|uniref:Uncharacterized protein n=1 Tax=Armillaria ostoyae TaxID=47428 RepID=A0A284SCC8_ARMOS|nr:uncharacterized protein ARMOST_22254 [Armillaria ostoyae]
MSALCYVTYRPHQPTLTLSSTTSTRRVTQRHNAIRRADASCLVISSTLIFEEFVPMLLTENGDIFGVLVLPFLTESDADMVGVRWSLVNFIRGASESDLHWSGNVSFPVCQCYSLRKCPLALALIDIFEA